MQPEAVSALPAWAQIFFYVGTFIGLATLGFRQYVKAGRTGEEKTGQAQITAAAIFGTGEMRELTNELYRTQQALRDHCGCLNENTNALNRLYRQRDERTERDER